MPLPAAIETVTVNFGPFPDFQGNLMDGTVTFTPVTPVPLVHVPTGTPIVKRPMTVPFTGATGSVGSLTLPATNASDLTVTDFGYTVTVRFNQKDAEQWPTRTVQLPKEVPTVDLDVLPAVTAATGVVVNLPAVLSVAGLTGIVAAADLTAALGTIPGGTAVQVGTTAGTVAAGDDPRIVNALQSTTVDTLTTIGQAAYDALTPAARDDPTILYVITGA
jgi:hypothetical protein